MDNDRLNYLWSHYSDEIKKEFFLSERSYMVPPTEDMWLDPLLPDFVQNGCGYIEHSYPARSIYPPAQTEEHSCEFVAVVLNGDSYGPTYSMSLREWGRTDERGTPVRGLLYQSSIPCYASTLMPLNEPLNAMRWVLGFIDKCLQHDESLTIDTMSHIMNNMMRKMRGSHNVHISPYFFTDAALAQSYKDVVSSLSMNVRPYGLPLPPRGRATSPLRTVANPPTAPSSKPSAPRQAISRRILLD